SSASAARTRSGRSRTSSPRARPLPADPVKSLADALSARVGTEVVLERPGEAGHGDYATNAALRLAGMRRQPPRALAEEIAAVAAELPDVERAEAAGPGFVNLFLCDSWFARALGAT